MADKNKPLAEEGQDAIAVGQVYKEKNGDMEVTPFFVDLHTAHVRFNQIGRASEDQMRTSDFLNRFSYVGPQSSHAETKAK